jgi:hypothetical protein
VTLDESIRSAADLERAVEHGSRMLRSIDAPKTASGTS